MLVTWAECRAELAQTIRCAMPAGRPLRVLEAGCGRSWALDVPREAVEITGVDLDREALDARTDLTYAVHGDLQDPGLLQGTYDVVYSQFVLEHIPDPHKAMRALIDWTAPGGKLIIVVPDSRSAYGWVAEHTPHRAHVWAHRYVFGQPHAGKPGYAPYPIHYSDIVTRPGLEMFARQNGLYVEASYLITGMSNSMPRLVHGAKRLLSVFSSGRLAWRHDNLAYVFRK